MLVPLWPCPLRVRPTASGRAGTLLAKVASDGCLERYPSLLLLLLPCLIHLPSSCTCPLQSTCGDNSLCKSATPENVCSGGGCLDDNTCNGDAEGFCGVRLQQGSVADVPARRLSWAWRAPCLMNAAPGRFESCTAGEEHVPRNAFGFIADSSPWAAADEGALPNADCSSHLQSCPDDELLAQWLRHRCLQTHLRLSHC